MSLPSSFRLGLLLLASPLAFAHAQTEFGQNKVVLTDHEWKVVSSPHFDIHYYEGSAGWAPRAARMLEKHYDRYSKDFDVEFKGKVAFFLYANINDFQQSNIVTTGDGVGGVTEAFKDRFMVYSDGSEEWLEDVLAHELVHVFQFKILLGGFWKSIRILKLYFYPQWVMEGAAEHGTGDLNIYNEDMVVRDAATTPGYLLPVTLLQNFAHLKPHQITLAYKEGSEAMRFIDREYGADKIPAMFRLFTSRFETSSVLLDLLGLDLGAFDRKFQEYVTEKYQRQVREAKLREPEVYGDPVTAPVDDIPQFNSSPVLLPDGRSVAFLSTRRGHPPEVWEVELGGSRKRRLVGKASSDIENLPMGNFSQVSRVLSASKDGRFLAFTAQKNHREILFLYDRRGGRLERRELPGFMTLGEPFFAPDGGSLVFSGMREGFTDIYRYDLKTRQVAALTADPQDDQSPACSPDGRWIAYSTEVNGDGADPHQRTLALLPAAGGVPELLPRLGGRSRDPVFSPDGKRLLFVNDSTGVNEIYELDLETRSAVRLTRTIGGNFTPAYSPDGNSIAFTSHRHGDEHIYLGARTRFLSEKAEPAAATTAELSSAPVHPAFTLSAERPYRFRASTDLFLPAFFFSSPGGLFWTHYWQASDYLGNHEVSNYINYNSGAPYLTYNLSYAYSRFRPQFIALAQGISVHDQYDAPTNSQVDHRDDQVAAGVVYPFDRYHRMELTAGLETERIRYKDFGVTTVDEYRTVKVAAVRDTSSGRYLLPVEGSRLRAEYEKNVPALGGNRDFEVRSVEGQQFVPLGGQKSLALRVLGQDSVGPDARFFSMTGVPGGVRGYRRETLDNVGRYMAQGTAEFRFPLMPNLDYDLALFFPDLYFKALYGAVFDDIGAAWATRDAAGNAKLSQAENAVGFGLRTYVFILQAFPLVISFDIAKQTTAQNWVGYLYIGQSF